MRTRTESACVSCGLGGCSSCSLNRSYEVGLCDACGCELDETSYAEIGQYEILCKDCAEKFGAFIEDEDGDTYLDDEKWEEVDTNDYLRGEQEAAYDAWGDFMYEEQRDMTA